MASLVWFLMWLISSGSTRRLMKYCKARSLVGLRFCEPFPGHPYSSSRPMPIPPAASAPPITPRSYMLVVLCMLSHAATSTPWSLDMTGDNECHGQQQEGSPHLPGGHEEIPRQQSSQAKDEENQPDSLVPVNGTECFREEAGQRQGQVLLLTVPDPTVEGTRQYLLPCPFPTALASLGCQRCGTAEGLWEALPRKVQRQGETGCSSVCGSQIHSIDHQIWEGVRLPRRVYRGLFTAHLLWKS